MWGSELLIETPDVVEVGRIALRQLIEDELLLAVPLVPRNPELEAFDLSTGKYEFEEDATRQPFAELAKLKSSLEQE